jgi:catechol 2,3-dioxygenase-like lactoylglutathione lyase family enzyme
MREPTRSSAWWCASTPPSESRWPQGVAAAGCWVGRPSGRPHASMTSDSAASRGHNDSPSTVALARFTAVIVPIRFAAAPGGRPTRHLEHARNGSLVAMFDHVGIAVSDLAVSERFYRSVLSVLGVEPSHADAELVEWEDWGIVPTDREHPVTRGLHVGFRAPDRAAVDAFWQAEIDAGHPDDGAPGPRAVYGPDYYGGFLLDPDGNSVEAVHGDRERPVPDGRVDHLWLRVRDPQASRRFYTTIAPHAGLRLGDDDPGRVQFRGEDYSFSLIDDERPLTEHVHLAFPADADATVRAFHAAALAAGYEDHGAPGERAVYHPGYYGAFVLDPDGHNIELVNHNR